MGKGIGRSKQREHIFRILFGVQFYEKEEMEQQMDWYFELLSETEGLESAAGPSEEDMKSIRERSLKITGHIEELDKMIDEHTVGWKTTRMNKADLTILRLAVYEMKWDEGVPEKVAINEAVELAKKYSGNEGPSFINGVLAKFVS